MNKYFIVASRYAKNLSYIFTGPLSVRPLGHVAMEGGLLYAMNYRTGRCPDAAVFVDVEDAVEFAAGAV